MEKTMVKFRAAALNCDRHNKREKQLGHTRPELQPTDKKKWMWETPGKQSVYMMRKQAEREYHAIPVVAHGKHGNYITHKSLPKNAVPVKEAVVRIKKDTSIEDLRHLAAFWEKKWGIRAVGIYIHLDEGHWGTLKDGQTEDMYRRDDGKEWKRMNEFGEWEYWKPNYHAHIVFDWFDHKKARCISLDKQDMSQKESDSARILGMERGTPKTISGVHALDTWDFKKQEESKRLAEKYARGKEKIQEQHDTITTLDGEITTKQQKLNEQDLDYRRTDIKVKGLSRMIENLTTNKNYIIEEIRQLEEDANNGRISIDELQRKAQQLHQQLEETEQKIKDKKEKLDKATEQLDRILDQKAAAQHKYDDLQRAINREKHTLEEMTTHRTIQETQAKGWQEFTSESRDMYSRLDDYRDNLPYSDRRLFDKFKSDILDDSIIGDAVERSEEIIAIAGALYMGSVEQAMNFAQSRGGGGGGPEKGWGRKPGEDDESFRGRCFGMARLMMRPPGRNQQQSQRRRR